MKKPQNTQLYQSKNEKGTDDQPTVDEKQNSEQKELKPNLPSEVNKQQKQKQGKLQHHGTTSAAHENKRNLSYDDKDAEPEDDYKDVIIKSKKR